MRDPARELEDEERDGSSARWRNVGGTRGGIGEFLIGLALLIAGGYLFLDNVVVTGNFWSMFGFSGFSSFGLLLIPFFIGVALLFFSGRSILGWLLTGGSVVAIIVGVISQLHVFFKPTSLFNTLGMFVLMAGGLGLIVRSLRAH
jgi:hypothetical protein